MACRQSLGAAGVELSPSRSTGGGRFDLGHLRWGHEEAVLLVTSRIHRARKLVRLQGRKLDIDMQTERGESMVKIHFISMYIDGKLSGAQECTNGAT